MLRHFASPTATVSNDDRRLWFFGAAARASQEDEQARTEAAWMNEQVNRSPGQKRHKFGFLIKQSGCSVIQSARAFT